MRSTVVLVLLLAAAAECAIEINDPYGTFESPGFPNPYPDNANQTWIVNAPPGYQIVVYFTTFDLENSYDVEMGGYCAYDYVELEHEASRFRYCGKASERSHINAPGVYDKFRSSGNQMIVNFVSDYLNEEPRPFGFRAHFYHEDKDECAEMAALVESTTEGWDELVYCDHFCVNVPGSYYCACRLDYVLHPNGHTCIGDCRDVTLLDDRGRIETPEYPSKYPRLTDCDWNIEVRDGMSLNFAFSNQFDVEDHNNYTDCPYDYVKLMYGDHEEKFCGSAAPNGGRTIMTNVKKARVEFHTDNSVQKIGFQLSYSTTRVRCNERPRAPTSGTMRNNTPNRSYYELDDVVEFRCDIGYSLIGTQNIVCLSNGTWSGSPPVCQIKECANPRHLQVPHSSLDGDSDNNTYLDVVSVICDQWYEKVSGTSKWVCNENSEWVGKDGAPSDLPTCAPVCGVKNRAQKKIFSVHISGGLVAEPNEWPWMAFINMGPRPNVAALSRFCGGSLIGPNHVLTAAHCATLSNGVERPASQMFVWLGAHDRNQDRGVNSTARSYPVAEVLRHPRYGDPVRWDNDVAVLRLASEVTMGENVRPICLPLPDTNAMDFDAGFVAGWGYTERQRGASVVLKDTELPTVDQATCMLSFIDTLQRHNRKMPDDLRLTDNMFCAGQTLGSQTSTCEGDSGGPFMAQTSDNKYRVYGVVSWGIAVPECGDSLSYSVFAELRPSTKLWVENQIL